MNSPLYWIVKTIRLSNYKWYYLHHILLCEKKQGGFYNFHEMKQFPVFLYFSLCPTIRKKK